MSLILFIVLFVCACTVLLIGIVCTLQGCTELRSYQRTDAQLHRIMDAIQCSYCSQDTDTAIGVIHNGHTYDPVCLDCQYQYGIRCPDGTISADYYYQVEPLARL